MGGKKINAIAAAISDFEDVVNRYGELDLFETVIDELRETLDLLRELESEELR
jgi:hypothetical protein